MPYATVLNVNKTRSKCLLVECRAGGSGKIEACGCVVIQRKLIKILCCGYRVVSSSANSCQIQNCFTAL